MTKKKTKNIRKISSKNCSGRFSLSLSLSLFPPGFSEIVRGDPRPLFFWRPPSAVHSAAGADAGGITKKQSARNRFEEIFGRFFSISSVEFHGW